MADINNLPNVSGDQLAHMQANTATIAFPELPVEQAEEVVEASAPEESLEQVQAQVAEETKQAANFKNLKNAKEQAERERDQAMQMLKQLETLKSQAPAEDFDFTIAPDELAEGKHLTKVQKQMKAQQAQLQSYQNQLQQLEMNLKVKEMFPDFDKVMTADNINKLESEHPEIAATLISSNNIYATKVAAYKFIKSLGIVPDNAADQVRVQMNSAKPKSLATVASQQGNSPLSKANAFEQGLTPDLAKSLLAEMAAARKNR